MCPLSALTVFQRRGKPDNTYNTHLREQVCDRERPLGRRERRSGGLLPDRKYIQMFHSPPWWRTIGPMWNGPSVCVCVFIPPITWGYLIPLRVRYCRTTVVTTLRCFLLFLGRETWSYFASIKEHVLRLWEANSTIDSLFFFFFRIRGHCFKGPLGRSSRSYLVTMALITHSGNNVWREEWDLAFNCHVCSCCFPDLCIPWLLLHNH